MVDTSSVVGRDGTFLIDPTDITVAAGGVITGATLAASLANNNVILHTSGTGGVGNITVDDAIQWASDNSLAMLAHNNITVRNHIRNAGGAWNPAGAVEQKEGLGNIYLVAGWNGSAGVTNVGSNPSLEGVIDMSPDNYFSGPAGIFGVGNQGLTYAVPGSAGIISIQAGGPTGSFNSGVVVGSRYGTTGLAARTVNLLGNPTNDGFVQVGFRDNGRIHFTDPANNNNVPTPLTWTDTNSNSVVDPGELSNFDDNYWWANINPNSALPGQGLALGPQTGARTGDRAVVTNVISGADAVKFFNGSGTLSDGTAVTQAGGVVGEMASRLQPEWHQLQAYTANPANAGHSANASAIRGDVVVNAAREVTLIAGNDRSYAQIGHVGANGDAEFRIRNGVNLVNPLFRGDRDDDGQPGSAGNPNDGSFSGAPEVDGAHVFGADVTVNAGLSNAGYLLLNSNRSNNNPYGYTLIGHGGPRTSGVREGNITVDAPDGVFLYAGRGTNTQSAIGHITGEVAHTGRSHQYRGNISVTSDALVVLEGNAFGLTDNASPNRSFAQIGHGGPIAASNDLGAGNNLNGAGGDTNQIRLGRHRNLMLNDNAVDGSIAVTALQGVSLQASNRLFGMAQIGHNVTEWGNDIQNGGSNAGQGPRFNLSNTNNVLTLTDASTGAITGGRTTGSVKVSHGASGIQVDTGGTITLTAGRQGGRDPRFGYAMIGSGGFNARMNLTGGDVTVTAGRDIRLLGGAHEGSFAQIGNGGVDTRGSRNNLDEDALLGNIILRAGRDILLQGGDAYPTINPQSYLNTAIRDRMYSMVGNGGWNADFGLIRGDLLMNAGRNVTLLGGAGDFSWAMVGNGGASANDGATLYDSATTLAGANRGFHGAVTVIAGQDVSVLGGPELAFDAGATDRRYGRNNTIGTEVFLNFAQIGHGGPGSSALIGNPTDLSESAVEVYGRDVVIRGGEGMLAYSQVGHGGPATVDLNFDLDLDKSGNSRIPTGATTGPGVNDGNAGASAIDVGYLFLIRPQGVIQAGPDGVLGSLDDGIIHGYANATLDVPGDQNPDMRFYALRPGAPVLFSVGLTQDSNRVFFYAQNPGTAAGSGITLTFDGSTDVQTAVDNWNNAVNADGNPINALKQIRFDGTNFTPTATSVTLENQGIRIWFDGSQTAEARVAQWNQLYAAHPSLQVGVIGDGRTTQTPGAGQLVTLRPPASSDLRFGADGIPHTADDRFALNGLPNSNIDDTELSARRYSQDDRNGHVYIHAWRDLTLEGGNRSNANSNISESLAYSQIGHGGPGSLGSMAGNIEVTVGRNLRVQGNFAGDGVGYEGAHNEAAFIDRGTANQATLNLLVRSQTGWGSGQSAALAFDGRKTLQVLIDEYNDTIPDTTVTGVSTETTSSIVTTASTEGLVPGMTIRNDPANPSSIPDGAVILWVYDDNSFLIDQTPLDNRAGQSVTFERRFDMLEISPLFPNAGTLVFRPGGNVAVGGGVYTTYAETTVQTQLGPVRVAALNPGASGNVSFQVAPGERLSEAVNYWNSQVGPDQRVWITSLNGVGSIVSTTQAATVTLSGGVDGGRATGSQPIAWFASKASTAPNPPSVGLNFSTPTTIWDAVNTWNSTVDVQNSAVQRELRMGYYGVSFVPSTASTVSSGGAAGANTFVVASATGISIGAEVTGTNIPTGSYVTGISGQTITINNEIATGFDLSVGQVVNFNTMQLEDLIYAPTANQTITLTGGTPALIDWNAQGQQDSLAPYSAPNFLFGAPAPTSLGINAVQGDAYAKIGHGEDVRNLIREPGMFQNTTFAYVFSRGDISVSVGGSADFLAGALGHANSQQGSAATPFDQGNTLLAVSRLEPGFSGGGSLNAVAQGAFRTALASGRDGINSELRIYAPLSSQLNLEGGSRMNAEGFVSPATRGRADTQEESEHEISFGALNSRNFPGETIGYTPVQNFTPAGAYQLEHGIGGVGRYTLFLSPLPPLPPGTFLERPTPEQAFDLVPSLYNDQIDRYERVDERSSDDRAFSFANYWTNSGRWRTDSFRIGYLGGVGGGNALVLDENGQWVPMPINLDPMAGSRNVSLDDATGTEEPVVPAFPADPDEKKKNDAVLGGFGDISTEGSGVNTDPGAGDPDAMGGAGEMGGMGAGDGSQPATPPTPDPFSF
jgi:hypothetical protein